MISSLVILCFTELTNIHVLANLLVVLFGWSYEPMLQHIFFKLSFGGVTVNFEDCETEHKIHVQSLSQVF